MKRADTRFDSAGSFLSINKFNKIQNFIQLSQKSELIRRYRGEKTKFRILPGSRSENSIIEYYESLDSEMLPDYLKERMIALEPFISEVQNIDLSLVYSTLEEYGIKLPKINRNFYKALYSYKAEEIKKQKVKRSTRNNK